MAGVRRLCGAKEVALGEMNVSAAGTSVLVQDGLLCGHSGTGKLNIVGGAAVRTTQPSGWIGLALGPGSEGYVVINGDSTLAAEQAPLVVGDQGHGQLTILGGADVYSDGELFMGVREGSAAQLKINGVGSTYVSNSVYPAVVGDRGTAQIAVQAGGRFEKTRGAVTLGKNAGSSGSVTITGTASTFKSPMLTVGEYGTGAFHANDGRVALGEIDPAGVPSGHIHIVGYGQLAGTGTVAGHVVNLSGLVKPGGEEANALTGVLTIDGNYAQQAQAVLTIKTKGRLAGSEYGVLNVTGTANLDGGLQLLPIEGFEPQPGDQFLVLAASNVVGTFATKWAPVPIMVSYSPDRVTVTILRRGDLNCDLAVNFGDINPFVLAISNPAGYAARFPNCDIMAADINADGMVNFGDINAFVRLLAGP